MIEYIELLSNGLHRKLGVETALRANLNEKVVFEGIEYIVMRVENNLDVRCIRIFLEKLNI